MAKHLHVKQISELTTFDGQRAILINILILVGSINHQKITFKKNITIKFQNISKKITLKSKRTSLYSYHFPHYFPQRNSLRSGAPRQEGPAFRCPESVALSKDFQRYGARVFWVEATRHGSDGLTNVDHENPDGVCDV